MHTFISLIYIYLYIFVRLNADQQTACNHTVYQHEHFLLFHVLIVNKSTFLQVHHRSLLLLATFICSYVPPCIVSLRNTSHNGLQTLLRVDFKAWTQTHNICPLTDCKSCSDCVIILCNSICIYISVSVTLPSIHGAEDAFEGRQARDIYSHSKTIQTGL